VQRLGQEIEQEQLISDQINYGMSVTQGGKRIDPMSIYKEPEQEPVCPDCKAKVLYECVACSSNNYPPQPEQKPCVHAKNPKGCYRVRCQVGDKCVDDEMSFRTTPPQPEQEPVAILNHAHGVYTFRNVNLEGLPDGEYLVYTFPPQRTEQEPQDWKTPPKEDAPLVKWAKEQTTPPQRTWVGLTDEEFWELDKEDLSLRQFVQAIEAKLKEKNT
jgi:hypothetical protein